MFKRLTKKFLALLVALSIATGSYAQTANQPFTLLFDHNCSNTVGYRLYIDGILVQDTINTSMVCSAGTGNLTYSPGVSAGPHNFVISAYNASGEAASAGTIITFYSLVVATPGISPPGGTVSFPITITLTTDTSGATIYYTINGSTPTTSSILYSAPFDLTYSTTVKAFAVKSGMSDSAVATEIYTSVAGDTTPPVISFTAPPTGSHPPKSGNITFRVTATDDTSVVNVKFAVNGASFAVDTSSPYTANHNFKKKPNGTYTITATAVDPAGNTATATIYIIKP